MSLGFEPRSLTLNGFSTCQLSYGTKTMVPSPSKSFVVYFLVKESREFEKKIIKFSNWKIKRERGGKILFFIPISSLVILIIIIII